MQSSGRLFIVSTPIGNLEDITVRAIHTLQNVDGIACEDTRTSLILLNRYGIKKRLFSFHKYSKKEKSRELIERMKQGSDIALITDAGTPGISDPGTYLVRQALEAGIKVVPVPGASALTCAVSISGLGDKGFLFLGFMPSKKTEQREVIKRYFTTGIPVVFYVSPRRLLATLTVIRDMTGNNRACVFKEMTKLYEDSICGTLPDIVERLEHGVIKGEYTVIVDCTGPAVDSGRQVFDRKSILEAASLLTGLEKREVYKRLFKK